MKEHEKSREREMRVEHINSGSLILNMAQMHSAAYLKPFHKHITPLNWEEIISDSVHKEVDACKQKAKVDLAASKASASLPKKSVPMVTPQNQIPSSLHPHIAASSTPSALPLTSDQTSQQFIQQPLSHLHMIPGLEQQTSLHSGHYGAGSQGQLS